MADLSTADVRIDNGGVSLACTRTGNPEGPPVLFLHGITSCRDSWLESTERIGDRFDCWVLDFRGHGDSDRAPGHYLLADYASDAGAVLATIGRPTIVVGHSLGGMTAAHLGHEGHPLVKAIFAEDPPLFLDDPAAFSTTLYPTMFAAMRDGARKLQADGASFETYLEVARTTPSPMGGIAADHLPERQLHSRALSLSLFDPSVLDPAIAGEVFFGLDASRPIAVPITLLAANPAYNAAFLDGDAERLLSAVPHARIVDFPEVGHNVRASTVSAARFLDELDAFVTANA